MSTTNRPSSLTSAGICLGIGMGGFVDGILFHQIFQLHAMLSGRLPKVDLVNIQINMFWDGLFHAFTWIMVATGISLFWRAGKRPETRWEKIPFIGSLLLGWGLFNIIEGVIDHHLLQLHHVVENLGLSVWDYTFLASGALFVLGGRLLMNYPGSRRSLAASAEV